MKFFPIKSHLIIIRSICDTFFSGIVSKCTGLEDFECMVVILSFIKYVYMCLCLFQSTDDNANPRISSSRSRSSDEPHIGKYRLIKTIGKGNFAKVKLAKHVPTGREVNYTRVFSVLMVQFTFHTKFACHTKFPYRHNDHVYQVPNLSYFRAQGALPRSGLIL